MIDPKAKETGLSPHRDKDCPNDSTSGHDHAAEQPEGDEMNALAFMQTESQRYGNPKTTGKQFLVKAQVCGVVAGLAGGVVAGILGALLTFAGWMAGDVGARHWLSTAGSVLLFMTIPLLALGGCCLDWLEK